MGKQDVLTVLEEMDAAFVTGIEKYQVVVSALNDRIRASHQTGEANSSVGGPDLALAAHIGPERFAAAVALRLAGLGLRAVVGSPAVARRTMDKHPRHSGEGFLDVWRDRLARFID